jgi:hypothetical protein
VKVDPPMTAVTAHLNPAGSTDRAVQMRYSPATVNNGVASVTEDPTSANLVEIS